MMEFLKWLFSDFWIFIGCWLILRIIIKSLIIIVAMICGYEKVKINIDDTSEEYLIKKKIREV